MGKRIRISMYLMWIGMLLFSMQVQAVEKAPEYEFQLKREKTYKEAKDPKKYKIIGIDELEEKYPERKKQDAYKIFYFDSITIDGITCSLQPWNEGDVLGQTEAFSKVYITQIGEGGYRGRGVKIEDLHRYVLWEDGGVPDLLFEETIRLEAAYNYLSAEMSINANGKEVFLNFDKEKVRVQINSCETDKIYADPYSEFATEWTTDAYLTNPSLEVNGTRLDYLGVINKNELPDNIFFEHGEGMKIFHEDGTICERLYIENTYIKDEENNLTDDLILYGFRIHFGRCEKCLTNIKIAGIDVKNAQLDEVRDKLSPSQCSISDMGKGIKVNYSNYKILAYCDYVKEQEDWKEKIQVVDDNYIIVE